MSLLASGAISLLLGLLCLRFMLRGKGLEQAKALAERELEWLKQQLSGSGTELQDLRIRVQTAEAKAIQLETELRFQKEESEARLHTYREAEERLSQSFQALSGEALRRNGESFIQLAQSVLQKHEVRAQGDMNLRQQAVQQLVEPISRSLEKVQERIQDIEKQRVGAYQGLEQQVKLLLEAQTHIQVEASKLSMALRSPVARGRWGELQLKRVVELAGMLAYCDFYEQGGLQSEKGMQRPDMIVRLPGKRSIVIDSKVPLHAYLEAIDCYDEEKRLALLQQHAQAVRKQVQLLGQKSYWEQVDGSPEFVLLFLPGEAFFSAALQADPSLLEVGVDHRVLITTPISLIALLRTSAYVWRQEDLARNAQEISRLGKELYQRLADLSGHASDMGKHMSGAVKAYNQMVGTIESRVLVTARRFNDLKADDPKKEMKELLPVEHQPRLLSMSEFDI